MRKIKDWIIDSCLWIAFGGCFMILVHFVAVLCYSKNIDPELYPYYRSFLKEAKAHGKPSLRSMGIEMKFVEKLPVSGKIYTLGQCRVFVGMKPSITISRELWPRYSPNVREMIIFHELAHCLLIKGHNERVHSLMAENIMPEWHYVNNREKFLEDLFTYKKEDVKDYAVTYFVKPGKKSFDNLFAFLFKDQNLR